MLFGRSDSAIVPYLAAKRQMPPSRAPRELIWRDGEFLV